MQLQFPLQFEKVNSKKVSDFILEQLEEAIILKELLSEEQLPTERSLRQSLMPAGWQYVKRSGSLKPMG